MGGIYAPTIIEKTPDGTISYDIFSRLTKDRIIMVVGEVEDAMAASVNAQLLWLSAIDPGKDIFMYINSPGGSVTAGMSMYDTMQYIPCDVHTIGMGMCASMGSFLLAGGKKGKRSVLPHTAVMIHQPSGGAKGQATDILIVAENIKKTKTMLTQILAERCDKPYDIVLSDMERDYYLNAEEALEYGIIDEIIDELGKPGRKRAVKTVVEADVNTVPDITSDDKESNADETLVKGE